ncbi:hypothetical protein ACET73_15425 [Aeromonas veronii]
MSLNLTKMITYYKHSICDHAEASNHDKKEFLSKKSYLRHYPMMVRIIKGHRVTGARKNLLGSIDYQTFEYSDIKKSKYFVFFNLSPNGFDSNKLNSSNIYLKEHSSLNILPTIYTGNVPINKSISAIETANRIMYQHLDDKYHGHCHNDIMSVFDTFSIIRIDESSLYFSENIRSELETALYILSNHQEICHSLLWNDRDFFEKFVFSTDHAFLRQAGVMSLTSQHITHSFLEIYKCFEHIYALPRCIDLKSKISEAIKMKAIEIEKIAFHALGWERKERDSINRLFTMCDNTIIFNSAIQKITKNQGKRFKSKINNITIDEIIELQSLLDKYKRLNFNAKQSLRKKSARGNISNSTNKMANKFMRTNDELVSEINGFISNLKIEISNYIYNTRCNIAHLGKMNDTPKNNDEWKDIIIASIFIAESIFTKYRDELV